MANSEHESKHDRIPEFERQAQQIAKDFGLQFEQFDADGIVASLGSLLLVEFSYDRDEVIISLGSRAMPDEFFPLEYVAVLQGWIDREKLIERGRQLDRFVVSNGKDAEFPGPLCTPKWLMEGACQEQKDLEKLFSAAKIASTFSELARIGTDYMNVSHDGVLAEQSSIELGPAIVFGNLGRRLRYIGPQ